LRLPSNDKTKTRTVIFSSTDDIKKAIIVFYHQYKIIHDTIANNEISESHMTQGDIEQHNTTNTL
jgi:hypothetical protein